MSSGDVIGPGIANDPETLKKYLRQYPWEAFVLVAEQNAFREPQKPTDGGKKKKKKKKKSETPY
jgi:hypothetical protein